MKKPNTSKHFFMVPLVPIMLDPLDVIKRSTCGDIYSSLPYMYVYNNLYVWYSLHAMSHLLALHLRANDIQLTSVKLGTHVYVNTHKQLIT